MLQRLDPEGSFLFSISIHPQSESCASTIILHKCTLFNTLLRKLMRRFLILACLALCVCSFLDGWSTIQFLHHSYTPEANPLFGKYPSDFRVWGEGAAIIATEILLAWWTSTKRRWLGWAFVAIFLIQAVIHLTLYFHNITNSHHGWR
jgi:hypothetical protein